MKKTYLLFTAGLLAWLVSHLAVADEFTDKISYIESTYGSLDKFAPGTSNVEASDLLSNALQKHKNGLDNEALVDLQQFIFLLEQNSQQHEN